MPDKSEVLALHLRYRGKIEMSPKCRVSGIEDFAVWYTPGVAEVCRAIQNDRDGVYEYTSKWNTVAVVSDGTRVLGLGDIGPEAGLPVMEGKALIFKFLGGVDAVPICLDTRDPEDIIRAVKWLAPSFGGINLEDIEQPKCFYVLDRLREEMDIPVWHDDQQGTAAVTVAGLMNALKLVGKSLEKAKIALIGAGAANIRTARMLIAAGATSGNIVMCDSRGILHPDRQDLQTHKQKRELCLLTNGEGRKGGIPEAMRGADALVALSRPGPGVIAPEWIGDMAEDPIVFACANPVPEILPEDAMRAGARIVATGRSDFPNQVNNSLGFPGIFRGVLDVRARTITDGMCIAAAKALARGVERAGLHDDHILPTMDEWEVYIDEAVAVGLQAIEEGVARVSLSEDQLRAGASAIIERARCIAALIQEESARGRGW